MTLDLDLFSMRIEYWEEKALTACLTYKTGFEEIIGKQTVEPEVELVI